MRDPGSVNRSSWNRTSDEYQAQHGKSLGESPLAWGVWRIPELEVNALGEIRGKDILEFGCGAAQTAVALARSGARQVVALDLSEQQLQHARSARQLAGASVLLVQASAEQTPFPAGVFDLVFCDHGAMTFGRPCHTVAEAARILRPGGELVFCMASPLRDLAWNPEKEAVTSTLYADYFDLRQIQDEDTLCHQLPYGEWIRLFRQHSLQVLDLIELRPPADAQTTYGDYIPLQWALRWPAENIWKVRKER
jgi:SAM-dependent methyltransferase